MGFFSNMKRNVGKFMGGARNVGKAIQGANRTVAKMTGIDPMKMLGNYAGNKAEEMYGKEVVGRVKDGFAQGNQMLRNVQGGDYESAGLQAHNYGRKHSKSYNDNYQGAVGQLDKYGMRGHVQNAYNQYGRSRMRP
jgi:hypothetical protein